MLPSISIIISTYNSPDWLEKVLWGYENQNFKNFQLIIADDGSTEGTQELISNYQKSTSMNIEHLWHPRSNCQRSIMLNRAATHASGEYLIFSDGDCIPRYDFVLTHQKMAKPNHFLSGGHSKLPMCCSLRIGREEIVSNDAFDIMWLQANGYPDTAKKLRLVAVWPFSTLLNLIPTQNKWNGHNASGWKSDILGVNGFDERILYGGEDREMGDRMKHAGIKVARIRYTAVCVHLSHERAYADIEPGQENQIIQDATIRTQSRYTDFGIIKG